MDGIPADQIERLHTPAIFDIASRGAYSRAYTGGEIGGYSQTLTILKIDIVKDGYDLDTIHFPHKEKDLHVFDYDERVGFKVPQSVLWEQDGMPFIGNVDICELRTSPYDQSVDLSWKCLSEKAEVTIYAACENRFKTGQPDKWIKVAVVPAVAQKYRVDLTTLPASDFYKFVLVTPNNHLNRWLKR